MKFKGEVEFDSWAKRFHEHYEAGSRLEKEFKLTRKLVLSARRWTSYIDALVTSKTGNSRARWHTLSALTFCDGPVGVVELSRSMGVKWPTAIRVLKDLEAEGLIRREVDQDDRRSSLVTITAEGRRVMARVRDVLDPARSEILRKFTDDELVVAERVIDELFVELVRKIEGED